MPQRWLGPQVTEVLVLQKRDLLTTRRFFTRALQHAPRPAEVTNGPRIRLSTCNGQFAAAIMKPVLMPSPDIGFPAA
ncbi:MAG: hypothetical protein ACRDRA_15685 [Pseudonocardiaceae bacterium]